MVWFVGGIWVMVYGLWVMGLVNTARGRSCLSIYKS